MKPKATGAVLALAALSSALVSPIAVRAQDSASVQKQKNDWRNLAIGAGAIGLNGLIHGNNLETFLGAAGAAYSAKRYEQERQRQSQMNNNRYYYRSAGVRYYRASNGRYYYQGADGLTHWRDNDSYGSGGRHYYWFQGHRYYLDTYTGKRVFMY